MIDQRWSDGKRSVIVENHGRYDPDAADIVTCVNGHQSIRVTLPHDMLIILGQKIASYLGDSICKSQTTL
jgi:hypothetical protein